MVDESALGTLRCVSSKADEVMLMFWVFNASSHFVALQRGSEMHVTGILAHESRQNSPQYLD